MRMSPKAPHTSLVAVVGRLMREPVMQYPHPLHAEAMVAWAAARLPAFFEWAIAKYVNRLGGLAVGYSKDAPDNLAAIRAMIESGQLVVFSGACERTIYAKPFDNMRFRVMHDLVHYFCNADVDAGSEMVVLHQHMADLSYWMDNISDPLSLPEKLALRSVLWADTAGQVVYFAQRGHFVPNQHGFVVACLVSGIAEAVTKEFL